jgi:hypothetical protein
VLVGGSLTLGVAFLWSLLFPTLRRVDRMESVAADLPAPAARDNLSKVT